MKDKILTVEKYLDKIKPYLSDMINNHKTQGKWRVHSGNKAIEHKTQLTIAINFISSKLDSDETRTMRTKSNNVERNFLLRNFLYLFGKDIKKIEESMKGSEFIFDSVDALYYDFNKVSLSRDGSYIDSPEWLKNKKVTINPKSNYDRCFQYALTVALNYEQIKKCLKEY